MPTAPVASDASQSNLFHSRVASSAIFVSVLTLAVKLLAGAKEALIGARFGRGDAVDIFLVALLLPLTFTNVVSICLSIAFIPQFARARARGPESGHELYSSVIFLAFCVTSITILILYAFGTPLLTIVAPGFNGSKLNTTVHCFFIIVPMLFFTGLSNLWSAILNTHRRFLIPALSPLLTTFMTAVLAFSVKTQQMAPYYLASSITVGAALECILVGLALKTTGFALWPRFFGWPTGTSIVMKEFLYLGFGNVVVCVVPAINQSVAARLGAGTVAALNYGMKLPMVFASVATTAVGSVLLPQFSKLAAATSWTELKRLALRYTVFATLALIPLTILLMWGSPFLVQVMFERGHFTAADTAIVSQVQALLFLQLPFVLPGLIGTRLLMSMAASRYFIVANIVNVVLTVLFTSAFVARLGTPGLGASTSVMAAITATVVILIAWSKLNTQIRAAGRTDLAVSEMSSTAIGERAAAADV